MLLFFPWPLPGYVKGYKHERDRQHINKQAQERVPGYLLFGGGL